MSGRVVSLNTTVTIDEELTIGTSILATTATGLGFTRTSVFALDGGHLRVVKRLDYEVECPQRNSGRTIGGDRSGQECFFVLQLITLGGSFVVKVIIRDINDNEPIFKEVSNALVVKPIVY